MWTAIVRWFTRLSGKTPEIPSPGDWIPAIAITVNDSRVTVNLRILGRYIQVWIPEIPDSGSMDPVFDSEHNNILVHSEDPETWRRLIEQLQVGDIAVYKSPNTYAIHRIVYEGQDEAGKFWYFQGDNTGYRDPDKVRPSYIQWICVGTIF